MVLVLIRIKSICLVFHLELSRKFVFRPTSRFDLIDLIQNFEMMRAKLKTETFLHKDTYEY